MTFDEVDQKILSILRQDGRASHAMIAKQVGLSAPAIGERIRKLEQADVIQGYQAVLSPEALGLNISAFVAIAPQPRSQVATLVRSLAELPEVEELHGVAGEYGYVAKVRVKSTQDLDGFLDRLWLLEGIERTQTTIILRTNLERPVHLPFEIDKAADEKLAAELGEKLVERPGEGPGERPGEGPGKKLVEGLDKELGGEQ